MTIDKSKKWWTGSEPGDLRSYLKDYGDIEYPVHQVRLAHCSCGSDEFQLEACEAEGGARRTCVRCQKVHFICDSEQFWNPESAELCRCQECGGDIMNVAVGFSLYEDQQDIKWIYVGVRCVQCGLLGCFAGWKVGYGPSLHLIDQV